MFPATTRIREIAEIRSITIKDLLAETGLSYNFLHNAEKSGYQVSLSSIEQICSTYGIPLWLFFFLDPLDPEYDDFLARLISKGDLLTDSFQEKIFEFMDSILSQSAEEAPDKLIYFKEEAS